MQPSQTQRMPGLDTLRAVAILAVMLFHFQRLLPEALEPIGRFGWMGVDLFFVLSGYLIGSQLLKPYAVGERPRLVDFYRRRAFRILPAYLVVLALYFLWPAWRERPGISPAWEFLSFTENLFVDYQKNQAFSHAWSLCVEEHFYLLLPLLILWLMRTPSLRRTAIFVTALVVMGIGWRWFVLVYQLRPVGEDNFGTLYLEHVYYPTWSRLDGLLVGVLLAAVRVLRPAWWLRLLARGHTALLAGMALTGLSMWLFVDRFESLTGAAGWGTVIGFPLLSLGFGLFVLSAVSTNGWLGQWRVPAAQAVATLAFSLYLSHKAAVHLVQRAIPGWTAGRGLLPMAIYAASCLAAAAVLYLCVERPMLGLRMRLEKTTARTAP